MLSCAGCGGGAASGGGGGGGGGLTVSGMVVDLNLQPIFGAIVSDGGSHTANTLSDGTYSLTSSNGTRIFSISAATYTTSYRKVVIKDKDVTVPLVILAPLDSKITEIGYAGGLVSNTNGGVKLNIPVGALSSATQIRLTEVPLIAAPTPPPVTQKFIAVIVYISPDDINVGSKTAEVFIPNITGLPSGTHVPFFHLNTGSLVWEEITDAGGVASLETKTISADIHLFGWTAAIVQASPSVGIVRGVIRDGTTSAGIPNANVWSSYFGTVADKYGAYELANIPTGEVTVEAIAPGYDPNSFNQLVEKGVTYTGKDIYLPRKSFGTVTGKITINGASGKIAGARVVIDQMETSSDVYGNYIFNNVPADGSTIYIYAYANNYLSNYASGSLFAGGNLIRDISLTPTTAATAWTDDFETNKGWTVDILGGHYSCRWQLIQDPQLIHDSLFIAGTTETYVELPDAGNLPTPKSPSHCYWFGVTPESAATGCYIGVQSPTDSFESGGTTTSSPIVLVKGALVSPQINMTAFARGNLSFWTWWETECVNIATGYDKMYVEIATNSPVFNDWTTLGVLNPIADPDFSVRRDYLPYSSGGFDQTGVWVRHIYDLNRYVGKMVKIRFRFDTVDTKYNGFRGWFIDDFALSPEQMSSSSVSTTSVELRPDKGAIKTLPR
jgi:hypothetical protein